MFPSHDGMFGRTHYRYSGYGNVPTGYGHRVDNGISPYVRVYGRSSYYQPSSRHRRRAFRVPGLLSEVQFLAPRRSSTLARRPNSTVCPNRLLARPKATPCCGSLMARAAGWD